MNYTIMTVKDLKEICNTSRIYRGFSRNTKKADLIDFMTKCDAIQYESRMLEEAELLNVVTVNVPVENVSVDELQPINPTYFVLTTKYRFRKMYWTGTIWTHNFMYGKRICQNEWENECWLAVHDGNLLVDYHQISAVEAMLQLPSNHDVSFIQDDELGE